MYQTTGTCGSDDSAFADTGAWKWLLVAVVLALPSDSLAGSRSEPSFRTKDHLVNADFVGFFRFAQTHKGRDFAQAVRSARGKRLTFQGTVRETHSMGKGRASVKIDYILRGTYPPKAGEGVEMITLLVFHGGPADRFKQGDLVEVEGIIGTVEFSAEGSPTMRTSRLTVTCGIGKRSEVTFRPLQKLTVPTAK